ncbi:zinc ABC transporter substrate-binding protein [Alphaproteobacteria bacterium KMM 3653]|uniref:High-affinity zinc uptake system protein ZnuA n=2 Tax=Harenicola maris TaxID=2841044 RepID=A0AAP2CM72_9RHOB|nr:zinc ABC transporter substrate-binding protein [Harenicola maris]
MVSGGVAWAEVPRVVTDILPVHGLVSRVMEGVGEADVLVPAGASPHEMQLRPSQAGVLESADLLVWVSPVLTPWLGEAMERLAPETARIELLRAEGTRVLGFRAGPVFEAEHSEHEGDLDHAGHEDHDDHDDHGDHEEHAEGEHEDHDDHGDHDEHAEHDDHGDHDDHDDQDDHDDHAEHEGEDHHDHHHAPGSVDPHAWLDPQNAAIWLDVIAEELAKADPENAAQYRANAEAGKAEIAAASAVVAQQVEAVGQAGFFVAHDAYAYFEAAFGLHARGAVSDSDAARPGPARIQTLAEASGDVSCLWVEPQTNTDLGEQVLGEGKVQVMDPLGAELPRGAGFYPALITALGEGAGACAATE